MKTTSLALRFILYNLSSFKWWIAALFIVASCSAIDLTLRPFIVKLMINNISKLDAPGSFESLSQLSAVYIFFSALSVLVQRGYNYVWMRINCGLKKQIGLKLLNLHMEKGKLFFEDKFPGNLASKTKDVMSGVPDIINIIIGKFCGYTLSIVIAVVILWNTSPKFSIGLICWIILYLSISILFSSKGVNCCIDAAENRSKVVGAVTDVVSNISTVRLFNGKNYEYVKFSKYLDNYVKTDRQRDLFFLSLFCYQGLSFVVYQGVCLFWLVSGLKSNVVTSGDFALVLLINTSIVTSLLSLSWELNRFSTILGDVFQALRLFLTDPEIKDKADARALLHKNIEVVMPKIRFENVSFFYDNKVPLFRNFSLEIMPQEKIGIVGYSGSGKSTFINLLLREFDVKDGAIYIDNQDIRSITQESLRAHIGIVPQDSMLFHRSLKDNIGYGKPTATEDEIITASMQARAHEFISQLPLGYNSVVGDRGMKLSGGQRQRIGIARVILKNAQILILDEATSQVDYVTESYIQNELFNLMEGKTSIVIAHRLSTLLNFDRIIVFSQGAIVGDGTHEMLLSTNNHYKTLWHAQIGASLPMLPDTSDYYLRALE